MSEKELLYIDDVLSHLEQLSVFCNEYVIDLEDEAFKNILDELLKENESMHKKFCKLLEG